MSLRSGRSGDGPFHAVFEEFAEEDLVDLVFLPVGLFGFPDEGGGGVLTPSITTGVIICLERS